MVNSQSSARVLSCDWSGWVFGITRMHDDRLMCLEYQTHKLTNINNIHIINNITSSITTITTLYVTIRAAPTWLNLYKSPNWSILTESFNFMIHLEFFKIQWNKFWFWFMVDSIYSIFNCFQLLHFIVPHLCWRMKRNLFKCWMMLEAEKTKYVCVSKTSKQYTLIFILIRKRIILESNFFMRRLAPSMIHSNKISTLWQQPG